MQKITLKTWLPIIEVGLAGAAGALWYLFPTIGPWPLLFIFLGWVGRFIVTRSIGPRTSFEIPLALFLVTAAVGSISAYDGSTAWSKFWLIVGGIAIFYAFAHWTLADEPRASALQAFLLSLFGAAVAAYFIFTHDWTSTTSKFELLERIGRGLQAPLPVLPGHRLHPNVAGGILAMMTPFGFAAVFLSKVKGSKIQITLSIVSLGIILAGLLLSSSRGAWIAFGAALIVAAWLLACSVLLSNPKHQRNLFFGVIAGLIFVSILIVFLLPGGISVVIGMLPETGVGGSRLDLLRNSIPLVMDYLYTGSGLGGYMMLYSTYSFLTHVGFIVHSHNLFLNVIIEQGVFALLSLLWMWLLMARALWRSFELNKEAQINNHERGAIQSPPLAEKHLLLWAGALSLVTVLVHGLVDDALYGSRAVLLLFLPLAFAVPVLATIPSVDRRRKIVFVIGMAVVLFIVLTIYHRTAFSLASSNYAAIIQSKTELGTYSWPEWPIQDAVRRSKDLSEPISWYEKALKTDPNNPAALRRLGQIELSLGQYDSALDHLKLAYDITPWDNATRQLLGEAYLVNGEFEKGQTLWKSVTNNQQQLEARIFWYEHIGDESRSRSLSQAAKRDN